MDRDTLYVWLSLIWLARLVAAGFGKLVWNANRSARHPDTRKRTQLRGHADDLIVTDVPHLRIIPQELWDRVHALCDEWATKFASRQKGGRRPYKEHLLAGLLRCGECGGNMRIYQTSEQGGSRVACAVAKQNKGSCTHRKSYYLAGLEAVVLDGMKQNLTDPKVLYHARWAERQKEISSERGTTEMALHELTAKIDRYVIAVGDSDKPAKSIMEQLNKIMEQLNKLEAEQAALVERLRAIDAEGNVVTLHPAAIDKFVSSIEALHDGLKRADATPSTMAGYHAAFRNVFDRFDVQPTPKRHRYSVTPFAWLAAIMGLELFPARRSAEEMLSEQGFAMSLSSDERIPT